MCKIVHDKISMSRPSADNTNSFLFNYQCEHITGRLLGLQVSSLTLRLFAIARRTALCISNLADVVEAYD